MEITVQNLKRVALMTISGRIDSNSASQLDGKLRGLLDAGNHNLVLELAGVDYISSAGLRAIVSALRESKKHGGDLCLAKPSTRVAEVLELAGLTSLFSVYSDTTAAVGSF